MRLTKLLDKNSHLDKYCWNNGADDIDVTNKLGQYEDIDESPEHLAKVKRAFDIIKEKQIDVLYIAIFPNSLEKYNKHVSFTGKDKWCLTEEEYDLLKEVLL